jgi:hypothetical protein
MSTPVNSSRRQWLSRVGKTSAAGLALSALPVYARSRSAHVIVVGGGFGGATAARYLKRGDPSLKVTSTPAHSAICIWPVCAALNSRATALRTCVQRVLR